MTLKTRIEDEVKSAMRNKDDKRRDALRLILSAIKQIEVDSQAETGTRLPADDALVLSVLAKLVKQRQDSIEQFKAANRQDLVDKETFELGIIQEFLPAPLSSQEIENAVRKAIAQLNASSLQDMGKVMAALKSDLQGRADMGKVSAKIKELLS